MAEHCRWLATVWLTLPLFTDCAKCLLSQACNCVQYFDGENGCCLYVLSDGQLRHVETGEPFEFKVREDHSYNQKRYEALGEVGATSA